MAIYKLKYSKQELVDFYESGLTTVEIAKMCECNVRNILKHLTNAGVEIRNLSHRDRTYTIDENYFDIVDTEEKAYILGFLYADGYNNEKRNTISIRLHKSDFAILDKINKCFKSDRTLRYYKEAVDLTIVNSHLSKQLANLGCTQKKSLILTFPTFEQVPEYLMNHFIRGLFDGDGCIYFDKSNYRVSFTVSDTFAIDLQKTLMNNCDLKQVKIIKKEDYHKFCYVGYSGRKQVLRIFDYMYKNATIYLERKYKKFISIPI